MITWTQMIISAGTRIFKANIETQNLYQRCT